MPPIVVWNISSSLHTTRPFKAGLPTTLIHTLPTPGLPHIIKPMISTRVLCIRNLVAGVLSFLVFCSYLYSTSVSKTYYNKAVENRVHYSTTAITTPSFAPGANNAGVESVASFYVTTSDLTQTEQEDSTGDNYAVVAERSNFKTTTPFLDWKLWAQDSMNRFIFLHVGKAGGSTLHCMLTNGNDKRWHCEPFKKEIESLISHHYQERCHMRKNCSLDTDQGVQGVFLAAVRNPITRIISTFNYEKGLKWVQSQVPDFRSLCFPGNITDFLLRGLAPTPTNETTAYCWELAHNITTGVKKELVLSHFSQNYQYYESSFNATGKHLLTIRQMHMDNDFLNLETLLEKGYIGNFTVPMDERVKSANKGKYQAKMDSIPKEAYLNACRVLCREIQSYKRFLYRAENLDDSMVEDSMRELREYCPNEGVSVRTDCPSTDDLLALGRLGHRSQQLG